MSISIFEMEDFKKPKQIVNSEYYLKGNKHLHTERENFENYVLKRNGCLIHSGIGRNGEYISEYLEVFSCRKYTIPHILSNEVIHHILGFSLTCT